MAWPGMASEMYKVPSPVPREEEKEKEEGGRVEEDVTRIKTIIISLIQLEQKREIFLWKMLTLICLHLIDFDTAIEEILHNFRCSASMKYRS